MKLSKTAAHAAMAMSFLAKQGTESLTQARQVGDHLGIPTESALKVLQALARHGLIYSRLGRSGGYRIDQNAQQITLLQVIEAVDGPITARMPIHDHTGQFSGSIDLLLNTCQNVAQQVKSELSRVTIADLNQAAPVQYLANAG